MKRVLMIAYHFPPLAGSSGIQRTLRFSRYLPEFGWEPVVLTAHPRAYARCSDDQLDDVSDGIRVIRAPAWDTARHFSIAGRYPRILARPDRWMSWWLGAVPAGVAAIRRLKPHAIWSTYPIATAHCIAATLVARTRLPWIADFRDPMAQDDYPADPATWRSYARIERLAVSLARFSTFTTPRATSEYRERYPHQAERIRMLENGYDEDSFDSARPGSPPLSPGRITVLHSGVVYPVERDPTQLFDALALLKRNVPDLFDRLTIRFRAPVHDSLLNELADRAGVADALEILPAVAYREALAEMLSADGLLILQASNCNAQVPAKLYEYFRARRPVIALTDPAGDTAHIARQAGIDSIAPLDDALAITELLQRFVRSPKQGTIASEEAVASASRRNRTRELAHLLDTAIEATP